jgi:uncharacterized protein with beta-barrel porin domain
MGFDYQVDPTRLVGFAMGASDAHFSVGERATSGDVLGGHVGAYGMATWGALYATGVLSYSRLDNRTTRTITGIGPSETATGSFASDLVGARVEIGRTYALPRFELTPFAALQTATLWQRGFTETTAGGLPGILGLSYQAADLPRRTVRHPPDDGERHRLVAVRAGGMGARVQPRSLDYWFVRVSTGYAVHG